MTPEQLADLKAAWPGDWQREEGHASVPKYELPVTSTGWKPGASVIPWTGAAVLQLRRDSHKTFAATGATFKHAAKNLRAKLRHYATGLHRLADEVPVPGTKTPRQGRQVPPAEFLIPADVTLDIE